MKLRHLVIVTHRDVGYFVSGLLLIYCVSGLALNHVDDWNPDFTIEKRTVEIGRSYTKDEITPEVVGGFGPLVGETSSFELYDFPTNGQVKIYYDNASFLVDLETRRGAYEKVARRPVFYQANVLHRNSVKRWRWAADVFSILLVALNLTGLFVLRGRKGLGGHGKWFVGAGMVPPVAALALYEMVQR